MSLTDIARYKNPIEPKDVVKNWMRSRTTIEFLGLWEKINNPNFKGVDFDPLLIESGSNSFTMSPTRWIEITNEKGNIRDYATLEQLVVLSNMESINALLIRQGLSQGERLVQLNNTAITQMKSLVNNKDLKKMK
ncbi:MAG: KilA-N domain-containing protein [Bacteroidales bacterium]|nr:KilA-N domain-containing protein [Bacteroidales bacterium]